MAQGEPNERGGPKFVQLAAAADQDGPYFLALDENGHVFRYYDGSASWGWYRLDADDKRFDFDDE